MAPSPHPESFVHGVDLTNWHACWNLALSGRLWSPDFLAQADPGLAAVHQPIRNIPIAALRASGVLQGVSTPRAAWYVWAAAWVRHGGRVGMGVEGTQWLPADKLDRILRLGDIELEFEEARRRLLPEGASRLASLYLADDSDAGRAHVRRMLGDQVFILRVTVPRAIRITGVDTNWFDAYWDDPRPEYIENYWRSRAFDPAAPTWEYLVDGMVEVGDPEGLAQLREVGAHRLVG